MRSEQYLSMVEHLKQNSGFKGNWTRNQSEFASFLLENSDQISKLGDLRSVFDLVQGYVKEARPEKKKKLESKPVHY